MRALLLPLFLIMAAPAARAAEAGGGLDARLSEAEAGAAELTGLAAAVARAFERPIQAAEVPTPAGKPPQPYEAVRETTAAEQVRQIAAECRRDFRVETVLNAKEFPFHREQAIRLQACRAVAARSMGPCAVLAPVDSAEGVKPQRKSGDDCAPAERCLPQAECRRLAGQAAVVSALVRGGGADVCSYASAGFDDVPPARRDATCRAVFAPGTAAQACAQENAAAGGDGTAKDFAECRARQGLKGAASERACADPALSREAAAACRFSFSAAGDPRCAASAAALAESYCGKLASARRGEIQTAVDKSPARSAGRNPKVPLPAPSSPNNARVSALAAFDKRNAEVEALLSRAAAALRAAGQEAGPGPRAARLKRAKALQAQAVSAVRAAVEKR